MIPFNKPYLTGKEIQYIEQAVKSGKISGNGEFTKKCHDFFQKKYGFNKCLLTTSCTDALEMAAILIDIKEGDEVIMPSFTFVSSANAFVLRGAKLVFADSRNDFPNINENSIERLITPRTKAIIVVHYAGVACEMDVIMEIANKHKLFVVEDAAQAIDSYYKGNPLGGIGHLGCFSFHETKNVISGEGGMLIINDSRFSKRADIIWEKGTNRKEFFNGEVKKYEWVDIGSSFLPSEIIAAFLYAQLENLDIIQKKRKEIFNFYYTELEELSKSGKIQFQTIPCYSTNNAHLFYFLCSDEYVRNELLTYLIDNGIYAVFHYQPLHSSKYYNNLYDSRNLENAVDYSKRIIRVPLYYELTITEVKYISYTIKHFFLTK